MVLDLGAAPGGWSQVASELVGPQGLVVGVDLSSIKPLEHVQFLQGDLTEQETQDRMTALMEGRMADVVLSDMSPDISGTYSVDQARSAWLCDCALQVAEKMLRPGGHFVCKIFEGEDTKTFLDKVKHHFTTVKTYAPEASRKSSSEIYIIAKSLKKKR